MTRQSEPGLRAVFSEHLETIRTVDSRCRLHIPSSWQANYAVCLHGLNHGGSLILGMTPNRQKERLTNPNLCSAGFSFRKSITSPPKADRIQFGIHRNCSAEWSPLRRNRKAICISRILDSARSWGLSRGDSSFMYEGQNSKCPKEIKSADSRNKKKIVWMNEWEPKPIKVKRRHVSKTREEECDSSEELGEHLGEHRVKGCEVCMPNVMRRERGRGGVALTSHVHYEDQITPDDLDRMDGLRPGLRLTIKGKRRLKKCIWAQTTFQVIKACLIIWAYLNHERVTQATIAACVFALIAIFSGHNALERQSIKWTKAYILFMSIATSLLAYPLYRQGGRGSGWSIYKTRPDLKSFPNFINAKSVEGLQDLGTNLLKYLPRQEKVVTHMRETRETVRRSGRDHR